ncbi:MAG: GNAT family N-acetyltransferase [bacterium]
MNITFRPFNLHSDREIVSEFLMDTKKITGDLPDDPELDCKNYIKAVVNTQKRNVNFCSMIMYDQKIIGFVDIFPVEKKPEIGFLRFNYLIEQYRGRGINKILMEFEFCLMKQYRCREIKFLFRIFF